MKLIIVAEVVGREALHRYGHPIKFKLNTCKLTGRANYVIRKWSNNPEKDTRDFKAIYSPNKYRLLKTNKLDVITSMLMVVDDEYKNVYKFCTINGSSIRTEEFNDKFKDLGLTLKTEMTKKEDRDAVMMMFDYKKIDTLSSIFSYLGTIYEDVYEQFVKNHLDLLIEHYLDHGRIKTLISLLWCIMEKGLLYDYIKTDKKLSYKAVANVTDILYTSIFKEHINILNVRYRKTSRFKLIANPNYGDIDKEQDEFILDIFSSVFKFFDRYFVSEYISYDHIACAVEDFFVSAYFLAGKPELPNLDKLRNIEKMTNCHSLTVADFNSFDTAASLIPYNKYINRIFNNLTNAELAELFSRDSFDPFKSYGLKDISKLKWLSKDDDNIKAYQSLIDRKDKELTKVLKRRYRIPCTSNTLHAINSLNSFESTMFFIYMNSDYKSFMKDIEVIDFILASNNIENILGKLDCSRFVNDKIKHEFISILLIRLEDKNSKEDLIKMIKNIKKFKKGKIDPEIISIIKESNYTKLKGAIKCNRL